LAELEDILRERNEALTLIVGNGINLANGDAGNRTWKDILEQICRKHEFLEPGQKLCQTQSLVELSDLLQLHSDNANNDDRKMSVQRAFCKAIESWRHGPSHAAVTNWAREHRVPILTTNYDTTLSDACGARLVHAKKGSGGAPFTHFYPWSSRYEVPGQLVGRPRSGFAIWHVNGMSRYVYSVRLGLSHYMGSVHQARKWMHRGDDRLFADREAIDRWKGRNTWLDAFFANDLLIFGLGLGRDETFLRWLLIERARYFRKFGIHGRKAWYLLAEGEEGDPDRDFFLEHVGVEPVGVKSHDDIYSSSVWNA